MIIYLARHAERIRAQDMSDREKMKLSLSRYGRLEAKALAKAMKKSGVDCVYSSRIQRAKETAEAVVKEVGGSVIYDDRLAEFFVAPDMLNMGELKSLTLDARNYPEKIMPSGESLQISSNRLKEAILNIATQGGTPCIVTHRVVLERFLSESFGFRAGEYSWMKTATVFAINVDKDGNMSLLYGGRRFRDLALVVETFKRIVLKRYE